MVGKIGKKIKKIAKMKNWQLFLLLLVIVFLAATFIRMDNIGMIKRRDAVLAADEELDDEKVAQRLKELQSYVNSHMLSNVKVQTQNIYKRDVEKAVEEASAKLQSNPEDNIYKKATDICDPQFSRFGAAYTNCIVAEVEKYSEGEDNFQQPKVPLANFYTYEFISPIWTPNLTGWVVLVAIFISILIIFKILANLILNFILKKTEPFI